jgi:hypothetical protein
MRFILHGSSGFVDDEAFCFFLVVTNLGQLVFLFFDSFNFFFFLMCVYFSQPNKEILFASAGQVG